MARSGIIRDIKKFIEEYNYPELQVDLQKHESPKLPADFRDTEKSKKTLEALTVYYRGLNEIIFCYEKLLRYYSELSYIRMQNERNHSFVAEIAGLREALVAGEFRKYAIAWFKHEIERGTFHDVLHPAQTHTNVVKMRTNRSMVYSLSA